MTTIRCDKCGKEIEDFDTLKYITIESPSVQRFPDCEVYELCPQCAIKLAEWINTKIKEE